MRKEHIIVSIIILGFVAGGFLRIYTYKKEQIALFKEKLKEFILEPDKFSGIKEKVLVVSLTSDTPYFSKLPKDKDYLILYFKLSDCRLCLEELKSIIDTFSSFKNLKVLVSTDHPVIKEIQYFIYQLGLNEVVWDNMHYLIGSKLKKTPVFIYIRKNKIKDIGIIAPLKSNDIEIFGLYAHKLKRRIK